MELSFIELVLWSIILCFIIAVTIQAIWLLLHKEQKGQALTDYSEWGVKVAYNKKDLSSYKPIQIMMKYGWQQDKPRKAHEFRSPYDELKHISMTMELMKECGYKL